MKSMMLDGLGRSGAGEAEARFRTGRSQAGEGRPVPSGTRGESTGMLQTGVRMPIRSYKRTGQTHFGRIRQ